MPATVGAYLAALGENGHLQRPAAEPVASRTQGPLQELLRRHGRAPRIAAPLALELVATCDQSAADATVCCFC
jgi:hypothetical protein